MEELKEKISKNYWKSDEEQVPEIAQEIMKLIKTWEFKLVIKWMFHEGQAEPIFNFLKNKKRTCRLILDNKDQYSIEAPIMDRDFFLKYIKEIFFPQDYMYTFENPHMKIEIFEGGLNIKEK